MYQRDVIHACTLISRKEFVELIFEIGTNNEFGLDTIVGSVQLGDKYVDQCDKQPYSVELAYVVTSIISKFNEDGNNILMDAVYNINKYVLELEREILSFLDYHVKVHNFMTVIENIILFVDENIGASYYHSIFYDLCLDICGNKELLYKDPMTLILGIIILYKRGWLKAVNVNRKRVYDERFEQLTERIVGEYECEIKDVRKSLVDLWIKSSY